MLSLYYNQVKRFTNAPAPLTGLVVSSSNSTTHIVPVHKGSTISSQAKRISLGGTNHIEHLNKSLPLRYPGLRPQLTPSVIQEIMEKHTRVAEDYKAQLKHLEKEYEVLRARLKKIEADEIAYQRLGRHEFEK